MKAGKTKTKELIARTDSTRSPARVPVPNAAPFGPPLFENGNKLI